MMRHIRSIGVTDYLRDLEAKLLACRAECAEIKAREGRRNRKPFWIGFTWGGAIAAMLCWYILRHGG